MERVAIVTGAASGIGEATTAYFAERGVRVFAGDVQFPSGEPHEDDGVVRLHLDVASDESVQAFVAHVLAHAPRIDWLINNAGYGVGGAIEEISLAEAHAQLETNFFGYARMTRALLPRLREQRAGRIVNVSSGAGMAAEPYAGFYTASKFAVEGYTEALWHELKPFPVQVSLLQPGWIRTNVMRAARAAETHLPAYAPWRASTFRAANEFCNAGPEPIRVAALVWKIVHARRPRLRYRIGQDVKSSALLKWLLPERWFLWVIHRYYRLHLPRPDAASPQGTAGDVRAP